ncbi:MAG: hypothetical protein ACKVS8_08970 [Phycisphaerales bacterium]
MFARLAHALNPAALLLSAGTALSGCSLSGSTGSSTLPTHSARPAAATSDLAYFDALDTAPTITFDDAMRGILILSGNDRPGNASIRLTLAKDAGFIDPAATPDSSPMSVGQAAGLVVRASGAPAATAQDAAATLQSLGIVAPDAASSRAASGSEFLAMLSGMREQLASRAGTFTPAPASPPVAPPVDPPAAIAASPAAPEAAPDITPPPAPPAPPAPAAVAPVAAVPPPTSATPAASPPAAAPTPPPPSPPTPPPAPPAAVKPGKNPFTPGTPVPKAP